MALTSHRRRAGHYVLAMDFDIPASTQQFLGELDEFIVDVIKPMEDEDDRSG